MALTAYAYNFSDTQTGKFDRLRLENQIIYSRNYGFSEFTVVFDRIDVKDLGQTFTVWFKNELPAGEVLNINAIVASHRGDVLYPTFKFSLDAPTEFDNRPNVVVNPAPFYWRTYFAGSGDNINPVPPSSGRGDGQDIVIEMDGPGDGYVEAKFIEPVFIHDCQAQWYPSSAWNAKDKMNISVVIPGNTATFNPGQTGNVNVVPTGLGYNVIVPAAGNGYYDLDLSTASPTPTNANGYWNVDFVTGVITPSMQPGTTDWVLLDIPLKISYIKNISLGSPLGIFDIETYKSDYVHPAWSLRVDVKKVTAGAGTFSGWFMCFRQFLT